jgi:hypothetical protein
MGFHHPIDALGLDRSQAFLATLALEHRPDAPIAIGRLIANDRLGPGDEPFLRRGGPANPFKGLGEGSSEACGDVRSSDASLSLPSSRSLTICTARKASSSIARTPGSLVRSRFRRRRSAPADDYRERVEGRASEGSASDSPMSHEIRLRPGSGACRRRRHNHQTLRRSAWGSETRLVSPSEDLSVPLRAAGLR